MPCQAAAPPEIKQKPNPCSRFDFLEVGDEFCQRQFLAPRDWFGCHVAGTMYRQGIEKVAPSLEIGEWLALVAEPDNPHDARAIRVETLDGFHLGYVPRSQNREPSAWLTAGGRLQAELRAVTHRNGWLRIDICVQKLEAGP